MGNLFQEDNPSPEELKLMRHLMNAPLEERTPECFSVEQIAEYARQGTKHPRNDQYVAHLANCGYCTHIFADLWHIEQEMAKTPHYSLHNLKSFFFGKGGLATSLAAASVLAVLLWQSQQQGLKLQKEIARLPELQRNVAQAESQKRQWEQTLEQQRVQAKRSEERIQALTAEKQVLIAQRPAPPIARNVLVEEALKNGLRTPSNTDFNTTMMGSGDSLTLLTPTQTFLKQSRPVFRWKPLEQAEGKVVYEITLSAQEGQNADTPPQIVATESTTNTQWQMKQEGVAGKKYVFLVQARLGGNEGKIVAATSLNFTILPQSQLLQNLSAIELSYLEIGIRSAQMAEYGEARQAFLKALKVNPKSERARQLLSQLPPTK